MELEELFGEMFGLSEGIIALIAAILIPILLITLAIIIIMIVAQWKVFKKSGKPGWASIIPFYNKWVLCEVASIEWWFFLGMIAPTIFSILKLSSLDTLGTIISLVASFFVNYNVAKKFGKETGFAIGLTLLPFIFFPILGFGSKNVYNDVPVSKFGPIKEK